MLFLLTGGFFALLGALGLLRMPDVYNRIQSSTKCVTVGTCFILAGSLVLLDSLPGTVKGILCIGFILLTAPTAAHALARAAHRSGIGLWERSVADSYAEDRKRAPGTEERP